MSDNTPMMKISVSIRPEQRLMMTPCLQRKIDGKAMKAMTLLPKSKKEEKGTLLAPGIIATAQNPDLSG